jgi:hypothetical protein
MAAFGKSCRRCGHLDVAVYDPVRKLLLHRSNTLIGADLVKVYDKRALLDSS